MRMHERLRKAREQRFGSAAEAARAFGWNLNTYRSNENGNAPFGRESAVSYASAFGVRLEWLLSGTGTMRQTRGKTPVRGKVGAGAAIYPIDEGAFEPIEPPFGAPEDAEAFLVTGDSMWPAYREGTFIIAQKMTDPRNVLNARAIVTLEDGRRYVKDVAPGSSPELFTLYSVNAAPIFEVRIVEAWRVLGTKEPSYAG